MLDERLAETVAARLLEVDDRVAEYCGELQAHMTDKSHPCPRRDIAVQEIGEATLRVLRAIQQHQVSLGN